jgi:menaquinone-dependent protoporphyrinogen oxidase
MTSPILVAYASKHGSTREVAVAIADSLRSRGFDVELEEAADVRDVSGYSGVVVGGALYTGRWHRDAIGLLRRHRGQLGTVPVAVFGMGPKTDSPGDLDGARRQVEHALAKVPDVRPLAVGVFGGVVDPTKLRFPFSRLPASDARDWDAIRRWADEVGAALAVDRAA